MYHLLRNDILRKHGVIPEKPPSPTPQIEAALLQARELAHQNRLEGKGLDELDALEDDEDDAFLDQYRQKRINELARLKTMSVYNQVYPVQKPDYSREVTEASKDAFVLVLLTSSMGTNTESRVLVELWRELAIKFGDIKFCQMQANLCIENYPDQNTPTILAYKDGDVRRQIVTLRELNGVKTDMGDMEKLLLSLGAVKYGDSRLRKRTDDDDAPKGGIRQSWRKQEDDDSDWD